MTQIQLTNARERSTSALIAPAHGQYVFLSARLRKGALPGREEKLMLLADANGLGGGSETGAEKSEDDRFHFITNLRAAMRSRRRKVRPDWASFTSTPVDWKMFIIAVAMSGPCGFQS